MKTKLNAGDGKVQLDELAEAMAGKSLLPSFDLTEAELICFNLMIERATMLQPQFNKVNAAISDLIVKTLQQRGLDTKKYGVNLGQQKILLLEPAKGEVEIVK